MQFYYKVRVVYETGFSDYTETVSATTLDNPVQPATDLIATAHGFNQIKLTWTDNSSGETGYKIYRKNSSLENGSSILFFGTTDFRALVTTASDVTEFIDNNLVSGITYWYYVVAVGDGKESLPSSVVSIAVNSYQSGNWVQKNNFEGGARRDAVSFVIGNKAYLATGTDGATSYKDVWEYDAELDDWTQKVDFPGAARIGAIGFAIHGKGYVGLGNSGGELFDRDLYAYDPVLNEWTKKADFPEDPASGGGRTSASVFVLDGLAYVVFGNNGTNNPKSVYAYDPLANEWIPKADFPGAGRFSGLAFSMEGKGYAGYGTALNKYGDLYQYDPQNNSWKSVTTNTKPGTRSSVVVVSPGIMLTGDEGTMFSESNTKQVHQYLLEPHTWLAWPEFSGAKRRNAVGFRIGNRIYLGTGSDGGTSLADIWEYTPSVSPLPATPAGLSGTFVAEDALEVSWQNVGDTHTSLVVERSEDPEIGYAVIATVSADVTKITDSGLQTNATYYYRVKAVNAEGTSGYTQGSGYTAPVPSAPLNLTLEAISSGEIKLTWAEDPAYATSFTIYRALTFGGGYTALFTTTGHQLSYTDTSVDPDRIYYYYVEASNPMGVSPSSEKKEILSLPEAPVIDLNQESITRTALTLNYSPTFRTSTTKEWYQSSDNVNFSLLDEPFVLPGAQFRVNGLTADTRYYFKMRFKNESGYSPFSNTVEVFTLPSIPENFSLAGVSATGITMNWTKSLNPQTAYRIFWKTDLDAVFTENVMSSPDVAVHTINGLSSDTQYFLVIEAVNPSAKSGLSQHVAVMTLSLPPGNLTVTGNNFGNHLGWEDPSTTESAFIIERSVDTPDNFQVVSEVGTNVLEYSDKKLMTGRNYHYRVQVVNAGGNSEYSNVASVISDLFVSVEATEIPGLTIYPNPVKDKLLIEFGSAQNIEYEIYLRNVQGKVISSSRIAPGIPDTEISMESLPDGLYVLQISGYGQRTIRLISKQ